MTQNELAVSSQLWALTVVIQRLSLLVFSLHLHLQAFIQLVQGILHKMEKKNMSAKDIKNEMDKKDVSASINREHIDSWLAIVAVCGPI